MQMFEMARSESGPTKVTCTESEKEDSSRESRVCCPAKKWRRGQLGCAKKSPLQMCTVSFTDKQYALHPLNIHNILALLQFTVVSSEQNQVFIPNPYYMFAVVQG